MRRHINPLYDFSGILSHSSPLSPESHRMAACILGLAGLASLSAVYAVPALQGRQSITTLSTSQVAAFRPYTRYASTAACEPSQTLTWTCGVNCLANPTFEPVASGGDGDVVQFCKWHSSNVCVFYVAQHPDRVCRLRSHTRNRHRGPPRH